MYIAWREDVMLNQVKFTIKTWAEADRPREKLQLYGRRHLTDSELVAILVGSGTALESALELSKRILRHFNNDLAALGNAPLKELIAFKGIGQAKAISIVAALELGRRRKNLTERSLVKAAAAKDIYEDLLPFFEDLYHEEFWVILLNRANFIISRHKISVGGQSATVVDPKIVFKTALENNAANIILAHNHPSGQLKPSNEDIRLTKRMVDAGKVMELQILDHLIITNSGYFSFADNGMI